MVKSVLKKVLPQRAKEVALGVMSKRNLWRAYLYDMQRFFSHSGTFDEDNQAKLEARLIAHYHVLEKGLSHPDPRPGFGRDVADNLVSLLGRYSAKFDRNRVQFNVAVGVIARYIAFQESVNVDVQVLRERAQPLLLLTDDDDVGAIEMTREDYLAKTQSPFDDFALSRFSLRDFSDEPVDVSLIERAVQVAQKSPSVCNRQTARVYLVQGEERIAEHLSYQSGNRGFGHKVDKLLVVTSDLSCFYGIMERNQCYIDGGLFAMSLLYALHHQGLGAVPLNWCTEPPRDQAYRKIAHIDESETIMFMIGVGHVPERFKLARSRRRPLHDVLKHD